MQLFRHASLNSTSTVNYGSMMLRETKAYAFSNCLISSAELYNKMSIPEPRRLQQQDFFSSLHFDYQGYHDPHCGLCSAADSGREVTLFNDERSLSWNEEWAWITNSRCKHYGQVIVSNTVFCLILFPVGPPARSLYRHRHIKLHAVCLEWPLTNYKNGTCFCACAIALALRTLID